MATGTVSVRFLERVLAAGVEAGAGDRATLVAAANLSEASMVDPDARLPLSDEIALWRTLERHTGDPGFAVKLGATFLLQRSGLFGYIVGSSATLRDAVRSVERFGRIYSDASRWRITRDGSLEWCPPPIARGVQFAEDYRLAAVVRGARDITGVDLAPIEVRFTQQQPRETLAHREFFRSALRFGAARAAVGFRAADLSLPVTRADATLSTYLTAYGEQQLKARRQEGTVSDAVRAAIWSLHEHRPSIQRVAAAMQLPARTLQRHLAAEGTNYHRELESILRSVAISTLRDTSVPIDEVASRLGYSERSAFHRSFKRWTGTTPADFRRQAA